MNEWVIVAIVAVVVIFGASKLPQLARNVGKAQGEFKKGLREGVTEDEAAAAPPAAAPPAAAPPAAAPPQAAAPAPAEQPPVEPPPAQS